MAQPVLDEANDKTRAENKYMNRHLKHIIISFSLSAAVNILFFVKSATQASREISRIDRITMWLANPIETVTDWIIPGHFNNLAQIIGMFIFSLIFYTLVPLVILELWAWACGRKFWSRSQNGMKK
jgi:hypothetical protein